MAGTLSNFLIGIGFDFDDKGAKEVDNSIGSIKKTALQAGAAIAGAFGIKKLTLDFAQANDTLGKFSEVFGVIPNDVYAIGQALTHQGGSLDSFINQLSGIERLRAGLLQGDAGWLATAAQAGIDPAIITSASSATEAYRNLAGAFQGLSRQGRINAAQALGLDEASIRLLSRGVVEFDKEVNRLQNIRPVTDEMTKISAEFNDQLQDLNLNIGGVADKISVNLVPAINSVIGSTNKWFEANRNIINSGIDTTFNVIGDNIGQVASAAGLLAGSGILSTFSALAKSLPIVGSNIALVASSLAKIAGVSGAAVVGLTLLKEAGEGGSLSAQSLFGENDVTKFLDKSVDEALSDLVGGEDTILGRFIRNPQDWDYITNGGNASILSARDTIGDNPVSRLLDKRIGSSYQGTIITPEDTAISLRSRSGIYPENQTQQQSSSLNQRSVGSQNRVMQPITINIDGRAIRDIIVETFEEQSEQLLKDSQTNYEG